MINVFENNSLWIPVDSLIQSITLSSILNNRTLVRSKSNDWKPNNLKVLEAKIPHGKKTGGGEP
jgi:hypothetical protein